MSGPYEHPNAVDFNYRMMQILLRSNIVILSEKPNITSLEGNYDLLAGVNCERTFAVGMYVKNTILKDSNFKLRPIQVTSMKI